VITLGPITRLAVARSGKGRRGLDRDDKRITERGSRDATPNSSSVC